MPVRLWVSFFLIHLDSPWPWVPRGPRVLVHLYARANADAADDRDLSSFLQEGVVIHLLLLLWLVAAEKWQ